LNKGKGDDMLAQWQADFVVALANLDRLKKDKACIDIATFQLITAMTKKESIISLPKPRTGMPRNV
jgi:hypothetical protein